MTRAAATGSHKIREAIISVSPRGQPPDDAGMRTIWACGCADHYLNTRRDERLVINSMQPYKQKYIGKIEAWARYPIIPL